MSSVCRSGRPKNIVQGLVVALFIFSVWVPRVSALELISSIKPLELLLLAVAIEGDQTASILNDGASPHHYALRPSDMKKLHSADLIIWTGKEMEPYLEKSVKRLQEDAVVIELVQLFTAEADRGSDPHFWLDPHKAVRVVQFLADQLAQLQPEQAAMYQRNAKVFTQKISEFDKKTQARLLPLETKSFIALHDAYSHFIDRYHLQQSGAVTDSADHHHGVKNMGHLQELLHKQAVACVVAEQSDQLSNRQANLVRGSEVELVSIDPLAKNISLSSTGYREFIEGVAETFYVCLSSGKP